ncbi:hypothetical protein SLEP1_g38343 [Rubroshorea leprosula]|nr:hypothetical protein SLEP1_g38343 [Rubroshorea leprosula]
MTVCSAKLLRLEIYGLHTCLCPQAQGIQIPRREGLLFTEPASLQFRARGFS